MHIADVSYFVPAGTPLDRGAEERGNSVYVPGLVAPMLPHELADDACSLRPNVDRLTVTVEIAPNGETSFYRSVIRSRERFTYGQAQRILEGKEQHELADHVRLADRVSAELRRARFARGALRVESSEPNFAFDGRGGVERAWLEAEPQAHALIEELMILANEAVAAFLASRRREAIYRVHEPPEPQAVQLLLAKLTDLEIPTPPVPDVESMGPSEAARVAAEASERVADYVRKSGHGEEAFRSLVLRSLKQARYDPQNLGHSGLASTAYTHFTSPIRRYPDLVVHRALLREIGQGDDPVPEDLGAVAEHTSETERAATDIEYRADEICAAWLLERTLFDRGLGGAVLGRGHGRDPVRPLCPLRRRLRGLPARAPAARRLLRAERARHGARGPPRGTPLPARRRDRREGRGHPPRRRQGRIVYCRERRITRRRKKRPTIPAPISAASTMTSATGKLSLSSGAGCSRGCP